MVRLLEDAGIEAHHTVIPSQALYPVKYDRVEGEGGVFGTDEKGCLPFL